LAGQVLSIGLRPCGVLPLEITIGVIRVKTAYNITDQQKLQQFVNQIIKKKGIGLFYTIAAIA
jgi:hypothetical protein